MALVILDKKKYGTFNLDEKELQKTIDTMIKMHKEATAETKTKKPTSHHTTNF